MEQSSRQPQNAAASINAAQPSTASTPMSTEDKATASYIRRTLCAHHAVNVGTPPSIHDLLPPLTSSNDVDLQVYAIIAVILKEFVQAWYNKITPDHAFIDEVLLVIAHVTRGLEERVRKADLQALLLDEIPQLLEQHIEASRIAQQAGKGQGLNAKPANIYHAMRPHPALDPVPDFSELDTLVDQERNERAWRHMLVQGILAVVLPTEDLQNGCLLSLVEEIIAEMILGNVVSNRICQPWALWELVTNIFRSSEARAAQEISDQSRKASPRGKPRSDPSKTGMDQDRLAKFGLLAGSHADDESSKASDSSLAARSKATFSIVDSFWRIITAIMLVIHAARWTLLTIYSLPKQPVRAIQPAKSRPIIDMKAWTAAALMIELPSRMPWLFGFFSLVHVAARPKSGRMTGPDSTFDSKFINNCLLLSERLAQALDSQASYLANPIPSIMDQGSGMDCATNALVYSWLA